MSENAVPTLTVHWLLAAMFLQAFDHKITAFARFAAIFEAWKVVPQPATRSIAVGITVAEFITVITNLFAARGTDASGLCHRHADQPTQGSIFH